VAASSPRARPAVVLGYYAGRSGLGGAGGVGVGSNGYGSTFDYGSALAGIQNAASYGNIDQAESHLASLTQILQNDLDANRITDGLGLQQAFAATASYVQQQAAPNVADANQARWAALVGQLQNNAAALNADIGYRNSQGTLADTTAGVVVDRSQGGDVNTYAGVSTAVYGGPGGTSIVSPGAFSNSAIYQAVGSGGVLSSPGAIADTVGTFAQTTAQGGATGDQNAPITFGNVLNSPGVQNLGGNLKLAFGQIPAWAWLAGLGLLVASRRR
jgi:hypothetical protein